MSQITRGLEGRGVGQSTRMTIALLMLLVFVLGACTAAEPSASVAPSSAASTAATPEPTATPKPDDVTLRLDFTINGKHAPFILGAAKGFYRDAGINLTIAEGRGSLAGAQLVASKDDLVAFVDATAMTTVVAGGGTIRMVACFQQQSPTAAISFGTLKTPADLVGKTIGISPVGSVPLAWEAFKTRNGIDDSQVTMVQLDGPALLPALIEGRIDVDLGLVNAEAAAAPVLSGKPVTYLQFADWNTNSLAHGLVFHQDTINDNPDLVRRFVEASVRSWEYALENPEEAIDALMDAYPEANRAIIEIMFERSQPLIRTINSEGQPLGWMAPEDWQATVLLLTDYGGLQSDVPVRDFYTNEFIPN
jgi:NitT/TauT family transport system substrate-binding protein